MNSSHPGSTPPRVLGIDHGERKIGLAVSSEDGKFVFGRGILRVSSWQEAVDRIRQICRDDNVGIIVVGMPLQTDGTRGASAHTVDLFVEKLRLAVPLPVVLEDERMTSAAARQLLREAGMSGHDDEMAAKVLVEGYLARMHKANPSL